LTSRRHWTPGYCLSRAAPLERILRTFFRDLFGPSIVAAFQRQFVFREGHRDAHEFGCDVFVEKPFHTILHVVVDPSSELGAPASEKLPSCVPPRGRDPLGGKPSSISISSMTISMLGILVCARRHLPCRRRKQKTTASFKRAFASFSGSSCLKFCRSFFR